LVKELENDGENPLVILSAIRDKVFHFDIDIGVKAINKAHFIKQRTCVFKLNVYIWLQAKANADLIIAKIKKWRNSLEKSNPY
jgi:hypothetical protein